MSNTVGSKPSLLNCPPELILTILSHLDGYSLAHISSTCRTLYEISSTESLWSKFSAPQLLIKSPRPYRSWKDLYRVLHPYLYLGIQLWWLDKSWIGQLAASQYDPVDGKIKIKFLTHVLPDDYESSVTLESSVSLEESLESLESSESSGLSAIEFHLNETLIELPPTVGPYTTQIQRMRKLEDPATEGVCLQSPLDIQQRQGIWPPMTIPANGRTSGSNLNSRVLLDNVVKISVEKWHNWNISKHKIAAVIERGLWITTRELIGDSSMESLTSASPWSGIWAGDYGPHGIELLLFYSTTEKCSRTGNERLALRAVKLTGDPHVPRGEISFLVPDLRKTVDGGVNGGVDGGVYGGVNSRKMNISAAMGQIADIGFINRKFIFIFPFPFLFRFSIKNFYPDHN
ncbi:hypothetical protein BZA77DRAFT_278381 [Pyronema omphalodes]|nr:hypothetical protein BZA77DRAFT_278381 [Pyronema omphalodes]